MDDPAQTSATSGAATPPRTRVGVWLLVCLLLGLTLGVGLRWVFDPGQSGGGGGNSPWPRGPHASIRLETDPADATVMVDGAILGRSALTADLTVGLHSLRLEKEGFTPLVVPLAVADTGGLQKFQLTPVEYARLEIESTPTGAQVFVDGDFRGLSPLTIDRLKPGIHDLLVEKANFSSHQSRYTLRAGEVRRVTDIALDNRLLAMLHANLEISPRSIGNNLDLAHFFYVNNDMTTAVRYYMRARELANLPMPPPLPGTPPEDIAFQQQLFQDEIRRVKTEEDHHYQNFREYYGTGLDFETFRREYAAGVEIFNKWANGIQDLNWVLAQGQAALDAGKPDRAVELFSDYALLKGESGVALGAQTAALLLAGRTADAVALYPQAVAALGRDNPPDVEKVKRGIAWRLLGVAWQTHALKAVGAMQTTALNNAETCLASAVQLSVDPLDLARAQFAAARLSQALRDDKQFDQRLQAAFATVQARADALKANPEAYAECTALLWPVQYQVALREAGTGDKAKAANLLRQIVTAAPETAPVRAQASHALELLDSGKTPTPDPLTPVR